MATQTNAPNVPIVASATIPAYTLVDGAGANTALNANRDWVGVAQEAATSGQTMPVRIAAAGTCKITASEAILVGDRLYKAASGRVSKTATSSVQVGVAITAASGAGSIFEAILSPA